MIEARTYAAGLCLAGGNALGAYQAGFCETLLDAGFAFPMIAGTSVGGVIGALIAGNDRPDQIPALRRFWAAAQTETPLWGSWAGLSGRRLALLRTLLTGHSRLFRPKVPGLLSALAGVETGRALYDRQPMHDILQELVDFDRLHCEDRRLVITAIDAESGELVVFDSSKERLTVDHLLAATGFPLLFEPVRIGERWFVDAGLRCNLPLDLIYDLPVQMPCIAVDLFPLAGPLPATLTAMGARAQDILLAGQSAEAIARYKARPAVGPLIHSVYANPADQTVAKTLDYSVSMLNQRHAAGAKDALSIFNAWSEIKDPRSDPAHELTSAVW